MKKAAALFLSLLLLLTAAAPAAAAETEGMSEYDYISGMFLGTGLTLANEVRDFAGSDSIELFTDESEILSLARDFSGDGPFQLTSASVYYFNYNWSELEELGVNADELLYELLFSYGSNANVVTGTTSLAAASILRRVVQKVWLPSPAGFPLAAGLELNYTGGKTVFFSFLCNENLTMQVSCMPILQTPDSWGEEAFTDYMQDRWKETVRRMSGLDAQAAVPELCIYTDKLTEADALYDQEIVYVPDPEFPFDEEGILKEAITLAKKLGERAANERYLSVRGASGEIAEEASRYSLFQGEPEYAVISPEFRLSELIDQLFEISSVTPEFPRELLELSKMGSAVPLTVASIINRHSGSIGLAAASILGNASDGWLYGPDADRIVLLLYGGGEEDRGAVCFVWYTKNKEGVFNATAMPLSITIDLDTIPEYIDELAKQLPDMGLNEPGGLLKNCRFIPLSED